MNRLLTVCSLLLPVGMASAQTPVAPSAPYAPGYATINSTNTTTTNVVTPTPAPTSNCGDANCGSKPSFGSRIKGLFSKKTSGECSSCGKDGLNGGMFGKGGNGDGLGKVKHGPPPVANGGTLAFPHHTFVRSPRDWFQE